MCYRHFPTRPTGVRGRIDITPVGRRLLARIAGERNSGRSRFGAGRVSVIVENSSQTPVRYRRETYVYIGGGVASKRK